MVDPSNSSLPYSYVPLPPGRDEPNVVTPAGRARLRPVKIGLMITSALMLTALLVSLLDYGSFHTEGPDNGAQDPVVRSSPENLAGGKVIAGDNGVLRVSRGKEQGVSEKANGLPLKGLRIPMYDWTDYQLSWQKTSFHFQPEKNWMNDPNGPMYYNGWYHFFYQYNPEGAIWGNIVWGHAVSKDLIQWHHLPIAMVADQWYDANGVWTGSATILPDGQIMMLYTGSTNESVQVQNLAYPANLSDPFLLEWVKYPGNPVLVPPPGIRSLDFRDPTTAWITSEGKWRITIGSKINKTGISLVYDTTDFRNYELKDHILHAVPGTGMWECVDFYPVSLSEANGVDTSVNGPQVKHVLKTSLDDDRNDYYALGTYFEGNNTWVPDIPAIDAGIGIRYDYGKFYASKTFYDQEKKRRILWGWITEGDSEAADVKKGWASLQAIPRTVLYDQKTKINLIQWPVEEVESLRINGKDFDKVEVPAGSVVPLELDDANELDIVAEFSIDTEALRALPVSKEEYSCPTSGGAAHRGALGPFGLLVLANEESYEQTPVYFYIVKTPNAFKASFCTDLTRSSIAPDTVKKIYGSVVPVLKGEKLSMRILVDHSIVEAFAQEGRICITSRVYPTKAINQDAKLYLFNNATTTTVTASIKTWQMTSAAHIICSSIWLHLLLIFSTFFLVNGRPSF